MTEHNIDELIKKNKEIVNKTMELVKLQDKFTKELQGEEVEYRKHINNLDFSLMFGVIGLLIFAVCFLVFNLGLL